MTGASPTWVVELTPHGRGAVASVLVEGPRSVELVDGHFRAASGRPLLDTAVNRIVFGRWIGAAAGGREGTAANNDIREADDVGEEVVVTRRGEYRVEIHCHGGRAAVEKMIGSLVGDATQGDVRRAAWTSLDSKLQIENCILQTEDRGVLASASIARAAHAALSRAVTLRTATILLDQFHGALQREIDDVRGELARGEVAAAEARLRTLLEWAPLGLHLVEPWQVVLAGRPNVGKSSLMNALLGYRRAIVYDAPGTTRDVLTAVTALDGWPVELADTAGLHSGGDELEAAGVLRAHEQLARTDAVLLVFDLTAPWTEDDDRLQRDFPAALAVLNKCDLPAAPGERPSGIVVSAHTGQGIDALIARVVDQLVPDPPPPAAAVPFTAEQVQCLRTALADLTAGHAQQCGDRLASLVGDA